MSGGGGGTVSNIIYSTEDAYLDSNFVYSAAGSTNAPSAGANNPIVLFRNPSGSGVMMRIIRFIANTSVTNVIMDYKIFATPTVTSNGTSVTPVSRNIGNGAAAAQALVTTTPTISANGSLMLWYTDGQNTQAAELIQRGSLIVQANNAFLFITDPSSNNRVVNWTIVWIEVPPNDLKF